MKELLTRDAFRESVLERDQNQCVWCSDSDSDLAVHHIIERKIWEDGGYYMSNGASLCPTCHIQAEAGFVLPHKLWAKIGEEFNHDLYPSGLTEAVDYDKWGQEILYEGLDGSFVVCPNEFKEKFEKAVRVASGAIREINPEWMLDVMDIVCVVNCLWAAKGYPIMEKNDENQRYY